MSTVARVLPIRQPADAPTSRGKTANWLIGFFLFQMACQLVLLSSTIGSARMIVRTAAFTASLGLLFFLRGAAQARHPAARIVIVALVIVALSIFHPTTNSALAGVAHFSLYLAIVAPIFWVTRLTLDKHALRRVLLLLWVFHAVSASFGALQVYFPGQFEPALAASINDDYGYAESLQITLSSGESVFRPMGLTDSPGGAGVAGFYSVLLGIGFLLDRPSWWFRMILFGGMLIGMFALYLSQIRSLVVMLLVCTICIGALLGLQGRFGKLGTWAVALAAIAGLSFLLATSVGGNTVTDRLATLLAEDPTQVYYTNRGRFLEYTIVELLPQYPLGAGLGRWGMISAYFGDRTSAIWAEIQWTAWLLDGGVPLVVTYVLGILAALWYSFKVAMRRVGGEIEGLWLWGIILVAYDVGAAALTFNYPLFMGTMGLEFWALNAALFAAAQGSSLLGGVQAKLAGRPLK